MKFIWPIFGCTWSVTRSNALQHERANFFF